ncbi:MAG: hypothetical protein N3A58_00960 [Spirochaetes bacterium]|nr:hypothetical protein [Spirochaetota bacterium]
MDILLFKNGYLKIILGILLIILSLVSFLGFYALYLISNFTLGYIFLMFGLSIFFAIIGFNKLSKGKEYLKYSKNKKKTSK